MLDEATAYLRMEIGRYHYASDSMSMDDLNKAEEIENLARKKLRLLNESMQSTPGDMASLFLSLSSLPSTSTEDVQVSKEFEEKRDQLVELISLNVEKRGLLSEKHHLLNFLLHKHSYPHLEHDAYMKERVLLLLKQDSDHLIPLEEMSKLLDENLNNLNKCSDDIKFYVDELQKLREELFFTNSMSNSPSSSTQTREETEKLEKGKEEEKQR